MINLFWNMFQGIYTFFVANLETSLIRILLILVGLGLIYLAHKGILDPLILIPMGMGMVAVNAGMLLLEGGKIGTLFLSPLVSDPTELMNILQIDFLQPIYTFTFSNGLIACLIFMGIGAITDINFLMAKPMSSMLLAVGAELGTLFTLPIAMLWGFNLKEAAAIAMVGGADGPMVLYTSLLLAKHLFVPITVIAYVYLSLTYVGYPYLIRLLIPKSMRGVAMNPREIPEVPAVEKFTFSVVAMLVLSLLFPVAAPLIASFFVGVAVKEMDIKRFREFLEGPLLYGSTFFLGLILGTLFSVEIITDVTVLKLLVLGMVALLLSGIGGLLAGLLYYKLSKGKVNPLIGIAAVSCIPTCAKIAQKEAFKANKFAMILPFAMGPNVAGVITTAIITGIYVSAIPLLS
ncbi:MAG: sodium ion-translocating decarboxylase subunit beta [Chloroflexota bacterium]|nr:sodium ion-translocating decarboxylase subunit beta [Chloroflexota bacterium]